MHEHCISTDFTCLGHEKTDSVAHAAKRLLIEPTGFTLSLGLPQVVIKSLEILQHRVHLPDGPQVGQDHIRSTSTSTGEALDQG